MRSIIQDERSCLICGNPDTEEHHVFFGTANRRLSEKWGLKVYLCPEHHRGYRGVHHNRHFDKMLKREAQLIWEEKIGSRNEFIKTFGKSYL